MPIQKLSKNFQIVLVSSYSKTLTLRILQYFQEVSVRFDAVYMRQTKAHWPMNASEASEMDYN